MLDSISQTMKANLSNKKQRLYDVTNGGYSQVIDWTLGVDDADKLWKHVCEAFIS